MANPVLIVAEHLKGELTEVTFEMLGLGRQLADALQAPLWALLMGEQVRALAQHLAVADQVFLVEQSGLQLPSPDQAAAIVKAAIDAQPVSLVLVAGTNVSLGIGAVLAGRLGRPYVNFCKSVTVEAGSILFTSQLFGGKIQADVKLPDACGVVSVYPGAFPAGPGRREGQPPIESLSLSAPSPMVQFKGYIEPETGDVDITKQEVLVAVGRGIQSQDNLAIAEDLASALNGAVCASRPVIDQGWLPLSRQVGKSGMNVKPRLYLALGISGAPEHWEGMQGSQLIVAVNTDPKAPIFDGAHYGTTVDALDLVPILTEKVKAKKG
ncbi:MAG TPA: electron transfer flavoprotein subunit alpha/FixB family protein [Candidatus Paceibacterota bacterium]|nr:electron transfer flavoprotein subunit alpha/FixB family protein [Verrucomicrobiota bacterium]HRY49683.1 electron transfer flavoprotein subunit alpha/FixB family protein [Candidatus Paceibacterota bacterium]